MKVRFYVMAWMLAFFAHGLLAEADNAPEKVSVCSLIADPKAYDHKLVEVVGFASHGFEDSGFSSPECDSRFRLWMEYGGTAATGTMSTASNLDRTRAKPAVVEGIPIPLVEDEMFHRLDRALRPVGRRGSMVHAVVVARFFAGKLQHYPRGDVWGGYGHLGCCSLFMIQQVLSVDENTDPGLDSDDIPYQPEGSSMRYLDSPNKLSDTLQAQRDADRGKTDYAFTQPGRVAADAIAKYSKTTDASAVHVREIASTPQRHTYEGTAGKSPILYRIVVSRPAWLRFYATDPKKVAWVVLGAFEKD